MMKQRDPRLPIVLFVAGITLVGLVVAVILRDDRLILGQIVVLLMLIWMIQNLR